VNDNQKGLMDADDFLAWVDKYDNIELEYCEVALPAKIDKIFVSRQQRAVKSAAYLALESEMRYDQTSQRFYREDKRYRRCAYRLSWVVYACAY
jgi:hypothetical protein